jgi:hypothetical protein
LIAAFGARGRTHRWPLEPVRSATTAAAAAATRVRSGRARPRQNAVIEPEEEHMLAEVFCDHYEAIDTG